MTKQNCVKHLLFAGIMLRPELFSCINTSLLRARNHVAFIVLSWVTTTRDEVVPSIPVYEGENWIVES